MPENSNLKEYQSLCKMTAKKFDNPKEEIMTWGLGISGEAGGCCFLYQENICP